MRGLVVDFGGVLDGARPDPDPLWALIAQLRTRGVRTVLLSNDPGGPGGGVLRDLGGGRFVDEVVLSGDVGMAKPDPRIYRHAARLVGLEPPQCVFVDDLVINIRGAVAAGMVGVHHVDVDVTVAELRILFDPDGGPDEGASAPGTGDRAAASGDT